MLMREKGSMPRVPIVLLLALALPVVAGSAQQARKPVVERVDQLPVHSYPVAIAPSRMLTDDAAFARLVQALRRDLEADLRDYDIRDKSTLKGYYAALQDIAYSEGRWDDGLALVRQMRAREDKPAARILAGLLERPMVAAQHAAQGDAATTYARALATELAALPYDSVQTELKAMKASVQTIAVGWETGLVEQNLDMGAARTGLLPKDFAISLVNARVRLRVWLPFRDETARQLTALIRTHRVEKPDIWAAREVTLERAAGVHPVIAAIWDSGTDVSLFPGRLWTSTREIAGNGLDDDSNGFVDDVHGIAWSYTGEKLVEPLRAITMPAATFDRFKRLGKGYRDLQADLETPEADEVRAAIAGLSKEEVRPFVEGLDLYVEYAHGTHVAGIAARGNPAIRLLHVRAEWPYEMVPPPPTLQDVEAQARIDTDTVVYLKRQGARVVNMSWGLRPNWFESVLAANGAGGSPEERRALARRYFDLVSTALRTAIVSAPEILFVAAAGNRNSDTRFEEFVPGSYDLPNIMAVGAVDRAGDEAAFTSFGKVDVYANGVQVESVVPGGDRQSWSGTSMATPQVVNLAAKLFAQYPSLTAAQVRQLIIDGADTRQVGEGRTIRLLNAKASVGLAGRPGR
jgi:subtilisin family serine protease